jgi:hypothetical protein
LIDREYPDSWSVYLLLDSVFLTDSPAAQRLDVVLWFPWAVLTPLIFRLVDRFPLEASALVCVDAGPFHVLRLS